MNLIRIAFPLMAVLSVSPCFAEDWFRWRGPRADGISIEKGWSHDWVGEGPSIAWRQKVGVGFSSIVIKDGRAITTGHRDDNDVVHCLSVSDGETLWTFRYPAELDDRDFEGGPTSTPTIDGDRVYVLGRAGELFCLDAATGEKVWGNQIVESTGIRLPGWGFSGAPVVDGDRLLLNVGEHGAAINKADGKVLWSSPDRECGYATPVLIPTTTGRARTAVLASGRSYVGVDVESGASLWSVRWLTSFKCNAADPIIFQNKMFLSSGYNRGAGLFDLSGDEPVLIWKNKEMKNQIHSSILYQNHLYGIDGDMELGARFRCLRWDTGEVVWSEDDLRPGGLAMADGKLILLTESGELQVGRASPDGWSPLGKTKVVEGKCWTTPVLSGGRIYVRSIDGQVVCVDCAN